jgi:16S rRNA (uracil1498-N3)-methyltransferase
MDQSRPAARLIVERLPLAGETLRIAGEEASYGRARRVVAGDRVTLVDGSGFEAVGIVARVGKAGLDVEVQAVRGAREGGPPLTLLVAGVRPERLDWIGEKATELGAARLVLVSCERSQAFRASAARAGRLSRVVRGSAKQSERARWPDVSGPVTLAEALATRAAQRLFLDIGGLPFPSALPAAPSALLVGPEGGWTDAECAAARDAGWTVARLPAGKLRTETAAVAGLVLLRAAMGSFDTF